MTPAARLAAAAHLYTHFWRLHVRLPERYRQPCRVLAYAGGGAGGPPPTPLLVGSAPKPWRSNSVLIEFADGIRVVTSRWSIRRLP